jgi:tRNA pseudouridine55 synthase
MSAPRRAPRRRIDGVLLLDKPSGLTSNAALMRVKRLYDAEKAGHTGTLDPLASGLLPICFGAATRFAQFLLDAPKRYVATIRFGATTTTQDADGAIVETRSVDFAREALDDALRRFTGLQRQLPPAHSALKFEGRPYYDYARKGIDVPRTPREVTIDRLQLIDWSHPDAIVDVHCSKGTYVRALAADLGEALGCGAHLAALRRTGSGGFDVDDAIDLEGLLNLDDDARMARLLPVDAPVASLERLDVDEAAATHLEHGRRPVTTAADGQYRAYGPAGFLGVVEAEAAELRSLRLMPEC